MHLKKTGMILGAILVFALLALSFSWFASSRGQQIATWRQSLRSDSCCPVVLSGAVAADADAFYPDGAADHAGLRGAGGAFSEKGLASKTENFVFAGEMTGRGQREDGAPARPDATGRAGPPEDSIAIRMARLRQGMRGGNSANIEVLLKSLNDSNAIIRAEAARGLGAHVLAAALPSEAVSALERALADPYPAVIIQAAQSLARLRLEGSEGHLLEALAASRRRADGYGMALRIEAMNALGFCASPDSEEAVLALCGELDRHEDLSHDNAAVKALARLGHSRAVPHLKSHLRRLTSMKPVEAIALYPWQEAVDLAREALRKHGVDPDE